MPSEIKVPTLPESVSEATVLEWRKKEGDTIKRDETLVEIETEKVVLEVPSPQDGVLGAVAHGAGDTVHEGDLLAVVEDAGETKDSPASVATGSPDTSEPASGDKPAAPDQGDDRHGPAVRALIAEHRLDTSSIEATGRDGRITKEDVIRHLARADSGNGSQAGATKSEPGRDSATQPAAKEAPSAPAVATERKEWREPMSRIRQTIASRLVQAQQTAAMLTTFNEVDMTAVMALRARYREDFEKKHGVRLGFMSFFVKAAADGLEKFPSINAFIDGTDIVRHNYADIGIAVSSPRGLLVPVLRDAALKGFARIETEIADFGARAQKAAITMDELNGGTFTITNGGIFGSLVSTPILNPPQSAILGMHKIQERPVAQNGEVVIRPMMYLALSYDHRIVDGREAVQFLVSIKNALEDPARLLLDL
jgi:2-oxoglutarate dehydrogenase E2 component (dihydrolipoamide succinyltransferase)